MLAPLLIVAAVGLLPLPRGARAIWRWARSCFAMLVTARSDFLERAPLDDPYIQVALPPIPDPDHTMVLMTGDAPMGFIATAAAAADPGAADRRLDGAAARRHQAHPPDEGAGWRASARGGDLYLIADADDMGRARDAAGRLRACHPLAGMPAIRHQPGRAPINGARSTQNGRK